MIRIEDSGDRVIFSVWVQPRARRNIIEGEWQGALKIHLTAPPVEDRANSALRHLLAERLKVPVTAVRITSGERSRTKRVEVRGASPERIRALVEASSRPKQ